MHKENSMARRSGRTPYLKFDSHFSTQPRSNSTSSISVSSRITVFREDSALSSTTEGSPNPSKWILTLQTCSNTSRRFTQMLRFSTTIGTRPSSMRFSSRSTSWQTSKYGSIISRTIYPMLPRTSLKSFLPKTKRNQKTRMRSRRPKTALLNTNEESI